MCLARFLLPLWAVFGTVASAAVPLDGPWTLDYRFQQEGGAWRTLPCTVPGDAFEVLQKAGVLPDLQIGTNVYAALPYEQCEWRFSRRFPNVDVRPGERLSLRFDGVDTFAEYWLNGSCLGVSSNMFVPVSFDVTGRLKDDNELVVHVRSPLGRPLLGVLGRTRVGGTDVEGVRKAQHAFGWDIMPRLVSSGIWRGVRIETVPECRIADVHWMCTRIDADRQTADIRLDCMIAAPWRHLHDSKLRIVLRRKGREVLRRERIVHYYQMREAFTVSNADFWWPRDAGEPALYDLSVEFCDRTDTVLARTERRVGCRTVRLERADWKSAAEPGTFRFLVNGEPIYMHGCNVTPMDALHAFDETHRKRCQDMLVDLNCNMIRVWGGGVYEADAFYDFCDENGILVWQDFMMGNVEPQQDDRFAAAIYDEAKSQVVRLRSHPSLAIWCGNNEIDRSIGGNWGTLAPDPAQERISREVLPRVLREFDPVTPYLPSSPWWTPDVAAGRAKLSQDHLWGPRQEYFKGPYWCESTATFVSETGYHGCPNLESLRRMMTADGLYPWPDPKNQHVFNAEWNCKATVAFPDQSAMGDGRNSLMPKQVRNMFGRVPTDLSAFVEQSQTVQAEALKYWIELSRSRKGRTWGLLWWNLRDGWPIISDSVVDYWYGKKKAYDYIRQVQQVQLVTCVEGGRLVAVNDRLHRVEGRVKVVDCGRRQTLFDGVVAIGRNATTVVCERLPLTGRGMVKIVYRFEGIECVNHCLYGAPPFSYDDYLLWRNF